MAEPRSGLLQSLLLAAALGLAAGPSAPARAAEDAFTGPFTSWIDAKARYRAAGDGVRDDTSALQAALDDLGTKGAVLYLPAGTYRITRTLTLARRIHVAVVGEHPDRTRIVWDGVAKGPSSRMLAISGVAYSRFDRLTFEGGGKAEIAVDQAWSGQGLYFDTGNQYADDRFQNVGTGLRCGAQGGGCAETVMLRDQFINAAVAGVALKNFNALDMFIWGALFRDNEVGATNDPGAGNFHVYGSRFERSRTADLVIGNTGQFNFRGNVSVGSRQFLSTSATINPANITLQGNTILDTGLPAAIAVRNQGPVILLDNVIRSRPGAASAAVQIGGFAPTDLFSMGDTFTAPVPIQGVGRIHAVQTRIVDRRAIQTPAATIEAPPPRAAGPVFEVAAGSGAAELQRQIDRAAAAGAGAIVHLPSGTYRIDRTVEVPAGREVQIVGDGHASQLVWSGPGRGPALRLNGPSRAVLREFSISGSERSGDGIVITRADQRGGRVYMESPFLLRSSVNLAVEGLDQTQVEAHDLEHGSAQTPARDGVSVKVAGGPAPGAGGVQIFAGASSANNLSYEVSGGARLGVRDIWFDAGGGGGEQVSRITGAGEFLYAGSAIFQPGSPRRPAISLEDFSGAAALLNLTMNGSVEIGGRGSGGRIAAIGLLSDKAEPFANRARPEAQSLSLNAQTRVAAPPGWGAVAVTEQGKAEPGLLTQALRQARAETPSGPVRAPAGATDVRIYRVFVEEAGTGLRLTAAPR